MNDDLLSVTGGDAAAARLLRDNLTALRDRLAGDPGAAALRGDLDAVLAGRLDVRDLAARPDFAALTHDGMRQAQAAWEELTPEQRAAAVREGSERQA